MHDNTALRVVQVHNPDFEYPVLRVDVSSKFEGNVRVRASHLPIITTPSLAVRLAERASTDPSDWPGAVTHHVFSSERSALALRLVANGQRSV